MGRTAATIAGMDVERQQENREGNIRAWPSLAYRIMPCVHDSRKKERKGKKKNPNSPNLGFMKWAKKGHYQPLESSHKTR